MPMIFGFADRDDASMCDLANGVFELNGGVVDPKLFVQAFFHIPQNAFADRRWNISNGYMAG